MFTVNIEISKKLKTLIEFQNISCLRLIRNERTDRYNNEKFQNISCLRLILKLENI